MIYKYSQLYDLPRLDYKSSIKVCKEHGEHNLIHLGQLKLLFTELLFLTMHYQPNFIVIYVGAASGYHINLLAKMFKDLEFHLYDGREFDITPADNIKMFQKLFSNDDAKSYTDRGDKILFMSDIRNLRMTNAKLNESIPYMDKIVTTDMDLQMEWVRTIKPYYSYLKFRLPYGIDYEFLMGTIFLQPYSKLSTEARLMTNDYVSTITYDSTEFDEKMGYFNAHIRCKEYGKSSYTDIIKKYNLKNNWDNVFGLKILNSYINKFNLDKDLGEYFVEIIDFFEKRYPKKYNQIFN